MYLATCVCVCACMHVCIRVILLISNYFVWLRFLYVGCKDEITKWKNPSEKVIMSISLEKGLLPLLLYMYSLCPILSLPLFFLLNISSSIVNNMQSLFQGMSSLLLSQTMVYKNIVNNIYVYLSGH